MPLVLRAMLLALLCLLGPAGCGPGERAGRQFARHRVAGHRMSIRWRRGRPFRVGLRLQLAPGWHTYWQNPGDAGVPPELDFDLSPGCHGGADCLADAAAGARRVR